MADDALSKQGIYFDEVDKVCILKPEYAKKANDLKEECQFFVERIEEFHRIADKFVTIIEQLGQEVEKEKIKAIGARNMLQTMEKQKDNNQLELQAMIVEKSVELERLKIQLHSLQRTEMEQNEIINKLTH